MKLLMITGSYPPQLCGIGDYTEKLVLALRQLNIEVIVLANIDWSLSNYLKIQRQIVKLQPDFIHIQYPSAGYGFSLVPQILSLRFETTITIHEVIQAHFVRKLSLFPFSLRANLVFTNTFEKKAFQGLFPWSKLFNKSIIIPIGSNIPNTNKVAIQEKDSIGIVYFGQIRPEKGIEETIRLAKLIKEHNLPYNVLIVGQVLSKFEPYYKLLAAQSEGLIQWKTNAPEDEVSLILSKYLLAYLPFPDGVSERRGSLLAAIANNMLVFTTKGKQTTTEIEDSVIIVNSPDDFINLLKTNSAVMLYKISESKIQNSKAYIRKLSWENIAQLHKPLYISAAQLRQSINQ